MEDHEITLAYGIVTEPDGRKVCVEVEAWVEHYDDGLPPRVLSIDLSLSPVGRWNAVKSLFRHRDTNTLYAPLSAFADLARQLREQGTVDLGTYLPPRYAEDKTDTRLAQCSCMCSALAVTRFDWDHREEDDISLMIHGGTPPYLSLRHLWTAIMKQRAAVAVCLTEKDAVRVLSLLAAE